MPDDQTAVAEAEDFQVALARPCASHLGPNVIASWHALALDPEASTQSDAKPN